MRSIALALLFLAAAAAEAEPYAEVVDEAFDALSTNFEDEWAYTETTLEEGIVSIGRYDPQSGPAGRWSLLSVDGRLPNDDERRDYESRKSHDSGKREEDRSTIVRPGTLQLVEETNETWQFEFEPLDDDDEESREFMRHVTGTLVIRKSGPYVERITLENRKPIRPMPGVKIATFKTLLQFGPAVPGGPIVPKSIDVNVRGRAFLAVKFDETEAVRFGEWVYRGSAL